MKIALFNLQSRPNPDYANIVAGLRARGHLVYHGLFNDSGEFQWHDGQQLFVNLSRPFLVSKELSPIPGVGWVIKKRHYWLFLQRLRKSLIELDVDIVQLDPGAIPSVWQIPWRMPEKMRFVFDIKQINVGVGKSFKRRLQEKKQVVSWRYCARHVYDYTLFDYPYAAEAFLGKNWQEISAVVPVGINPDLLNVFRDADFSDSEGPVRFVYVGGLSRFRELERLLEAIHLAAHETRAFRVDFVGPEYSDGYYPKLAHELGLDDIVSIKPPVDYADIPKLLVRYDVGLAYNPDRPTWHYQPTIKVKEYRAVGLPIISTDVRSHRDFVETDVNGMLVSNSAGAWAEAIVQFVVNHRYRRNVSDNAMRKRMGTTIDEVAQMHESVYFDK